MCTEVKSEAKVKKPSWTASAGITYDKTSGRESDDVLQFVV